MVLVSLFLVGKDVEGLEVAYVPGDGVRKLVVNEADMSMEGELLMRKWGLGGRAVRKISLVENSALLCF